MEEQPPQQPSNPESPPAPAREADSPGETQQPLEQQVVGNTPVEPGLGPTDAHDQDKAPDADEPGDELPADLEAEAHEGPVEPDEVDQRDVQE